MKRKILKKLAGNAGESITETLVATLIAALALVMLAGAVSSAMRVVTRSKDAMSEYYSNNNAIEARAKDDPDIFLSENPNVTISKLLPSDVTVGTDVWKNERISQTPVIAYAKHTTTP